MKRSLLIYILMLFISDGCSTQVKTPPTLIPSGILIQEISTEMDLIFDSIRYVLNDPVCLDEHYQVDKNFIKIMNRSMNMKVFRKEIVELFNNFSDEIIVKIYYLTKLNSTIFSKTFRQIFSNLFISIIIMTISLLLYIIEIEQEKLYLFTFR